MKGLELSRLYYEKYGLPLLRKVMGEDISQVAAGLVGQGSECLGYDDEISRDHDFGPGFCLWVPQRLWGKLGSRLQEVYGCLPQSIPECQASAVNPQRSGRVGPCTIEEFYCTLIGRSSAPEHPLEWLQLPEKYLSAAANGEVFSDPLGEFSALRDILRAFYPEDALKKKVAADCALMAQSGQYNYARCLQRQDYAGAYLSCGEFIRSALAALYLLNRRYMPFYKWAFRGMRDFTLLTDAAGNLRELTVMPDATCGRQKQVLIEEICLSVAKELVMRGWSDRGDSFLQYHAQKVTQTIGDPDVRGLYITVGGV